VLENVFLFKKEKERTVFKPTSVLPCLYSFGTAGPSSDNNERLFIASDLFQYFSEMLSLSIYAGKGLVYLFVQLHDQDNLIEERLRHISSSAGFISIT
jgi:hypothetical protein